MTIMTTLIPGRLRKRSRRAVAEEPSITDDLRKVPALPLGDGGLSVSVRRLSAEDAALTVGAFPVRDPLRATGVLPALPAVARREPGRTLGRPVPRQKQPQAPYVLGRVHTALQRKTLGTRLGATPLEDEVAAAHVPPPAPLPQVIARRFDATAARLARYYPAPGGDYRELMAAVDRITGTTSRFSPPLQAAPPAWRAA